MPVLRFIGRIIWVTLKAFGVILGFIFALIIGRFVYGALGGDARPAPPDPEGRYK